MAVALTVNLSIGRDFRKAPASGDQISYLMQALSLAHGSHSLNFDQRDFARWQALRWPAAPTPMGLFIQRYDHNKWAGAKPYGYSLYLAPSIAIFGTVRGVDVANALLLLILCAICIAVLRSRFNGAVVPLAALAFVFGSAIYAYTFPIHPELFFAVLTAAACGCAWQYVRTGSLWWALAFAAIAAFEVAEKATVLILVAPLALLLLLRAPSNRQRAAIAATGILVFAVAVLPYLRYSDWSSLTPYSGARYQVRVTTDLAAAAAIRPPFAAGGTTRDYYSANFGGGDVGGANVHTPKDQAESIVYTFIGRHTGLLVYAPLALLILAASLPAARRRDWTVLALLAGIVGYLLAYAVLFPTNYYGGGQSFGNRYFVQIAPAALVLGVAAGLRARTLLLMSAAAIAISAALLYPNHSHPDRAFVSEIAKTSPLQRLLPTESNQQYAVMWKVPP